MPVKEYAKAYKQGKKAYHASVMRGQNPYLPALAPTLERKNIVAQENLGVVDIPLEQIVGTYYAGRQPSFSCDFQPLMPEDTEFAQKWITLCERHLEEGIRDPIKTYEYMNRFYVVEGHKRVSVLKYFGAKSIRGEAIRLIPEPEDTPESRIYGEFLRFYRVTGINFLWFSREGGFDALLQTIGANADEPMESSAREVFRSFAALFDLAFQDRAAPLMHTTSGDALLLYLKLYGYTKSLEKSSSEIRAELSRIWNEVMNLESGSAIQLVMKPDSDKTPRFVPRPNHIRAAFIHWGTAETSSWVYAHELGRKDLEAAFGGRVETIALDGIHSEESAREALETAVIDCSDLIFTTSPQLLDISVKAAVDNPKIRILNCSLNTSHPSVRTYYARMYEAKFLMGVIAGSLTPDDKIGYIADYPIYGIIANINAFALGAKMVNPRAKVYLEWSKTVGEDSRTRLGRAGISYISDRDMITAEDSVPRHVGLYRSNGQSLENTALSIWRWGRLYVKIVQNYINGVWRTNAPDTRAINYWWGMESGVIDLICSRSLPEGTTRLVNLLKDAISRSAFPIFSGFIKTQTGETLDYYSRAITPEEIITMDWLADNVVGSLPAYNQLLPEAQALVKIQGVRKS